MTEVTQDNRDMGISIQKKAIMEEFIQGALDDFSQTKEILRLEQAKKNLENLNLDLERDMLNLDEANQALLVQIREKELQIQSLEKEITKSIGLAGERDEFNLTAYEREEELKNLELETAKLERSNEILTKNVNELRVKLSRKTPENLKEVEKENLKQMLEESKVRLQKATDYCAEQEKELAKVISECQSVDQLCKDQAYYIKKYQEILRLMESDREMLLLETEIKKAQSIYRKSDLILEENIFKKLQRHFWFRFCPEQSAQDYGQRHLVETEELSTSISQSPSRGLFATLVQGQALLSRRSQASPKQK
ncbi:transmembrane and coiled-coil domain-containing protein 5B-like isoform X2 [Antechinus flavipes]|uniref:transmembrane and coiled-coil domain-containing protein 5B-like isoform X2 n=1 Tax=Antechinus flavipes TaxID=38775 RepID=UPI0022364BEB|nr:transmembrane and coiled-coil domain-containing protein 5B-like isoform X2 [Antechinus flavipes]